MRGAVTPSSPATVNRARAPASAPAAKHHRRHSSARPTPVPTFRAELGIAALAGAHQQARDDRYQDAGRGDGPTAASPACSATECPSSGRPRSRRAPSRADDRGHEGFVQVGAHARDVADGSPPTLSAITAEVAQDRPRGCRPRPCRPGRRRHRRPWCRCRRPPARTARSRRRPGRSR